MIHQSHPLDYIAFDRTMQDIVYKLVLRICEATIWIHNSYPLFRFPLLKRTNTSGKEIFMPKEACLVPRLAIVFSLRLNHLHFHPVMQDLEEEQEEEDTKPEEEETTPEPGSTLDYHRFSHFDGELFLT